LLVIGHNPTANHYNNNGDLMLRAIPLLLLSSVLSLAAQAEIYKMKDAQGNIIFTDTPGDKPAELVELQPVNTQPVIEPGAVPETVKPGVQSVYNPKILSPKEGASMTAEQRDLPVVASVSPALGETDELQLTIDGAPYGETTRENSFVIRDITRGEHNLRVNVISLEGKVLSSSPSVRVFVLRPSAAGANSPLSKPKSPSGAPKAGG